MALINLIKRKGINPQTKGIIYFPQWTRRSTDTAMELAEEMDGSTYSQGEITGMLVDFPKRILRSLMNGNAAKIPGLGTFKLRVSGVSKDKLEDVTAQGCKAQIVFDVDPVLAAKLAGAKYQFVEKPTPDGEQDANEETSNSNETPANNESQNNNEEENNVTIPEITGNTSFTDTTLANIQGPQGAAIYYTLDGSTPATSSNLYSEPITLTETTTVKAIAVLNGIVSEVASKTFTKTSGQGGMDQN